MEMEMSIVTDKMLDLVIEQIKQYVLIMDEDNWKEELTSYLEGLQRILDRP